MWLLLASRKPVPVDQDSARVGAYAGASQPAHNGREVRAAAIRGIPGGERVVVRVLLHPGRTQVCEGDAARICEQFDIAPQRVRDSLGAAELAAEGCVGFLLEVCGPFLDAEGTRHERGCLFARGLRAG
jgi:hypothetical protein